MTQVRFSPDDPLTVHAAQGSDVAVSADAGATWTETQFPGTGSGRWDRRVLDVATGPIESGGARRLYAWGDGTLWYSPDSGGIWYEDHGLALPAGHRFCDATSAGIGTAARILAVEPDHPDHLYLAYKHLADGSRYSAGVKHQGQLLILHETEGYQCNTHAALSKANQALLGQPAVNLGCGEGSVWLGDFSGFQPGCPASQSALSTQVPGPPLYWGGSAPSGRTYLKVPPTGAGYPLFFSDRNFVQVSQERPTAGGRHRLDGWDPSEIRGRDAFRNHMSMHVDPHGIMVTPDFGLTLKPATGVPAAYAMNTQLHLERVRPCV